MKLLQGDLQKQLLWYRRAQWGLLLLSVAVIMAIYLLLIRRQDTQLVMIQSRYSEAQNQLAQNQDRTKNLPAVELEIQRLRQRVERFDKKLPRQQDLAVFISDVTHISQDAALHKLAWHLDSKPRRTDQFTELPIHFTFEGDFQSGVLAFLRGTEDMPRLTRVRKLDLKSNDARDGQVRAEVTMNIYFGEE